MPPELKKPITSLSEMTCENCVFSSLIQTMTDNVVCHSSDNMFSAKPGITDFCSAGQWLWLGTWDLIMDDKPKLHLFRVDELYEMFARQIVNNGSEIAE